MCCALSAETHLMEAEELCCWLSRFSIVSAVDGSRGTDVNGLEEVNCRRAIADRRSESNGRKQLSCREFLHRDAKPRFITLTINLFYIGTNFAY